MAIVAAEYLAKGYKLSDHILQRAIEIDSTCSADSELKASSNPTTDKQGISKKFLSYMSDLDKSVGQSALGPHQTISGKVQSSLKEAHTRVKSVDEQKGYSKLAQEVRIFYFPLSWLTRTTLVLCESPRFILWTVRVVLLHQHV